MNRLAQALVALVLLPLLVVTGCNKDAAVEDSADDSPTSTFTLSPPMGGLGTSMSVALEADYSAFRFGSTTVDFGEGIRVDALTVLDGWSAIADITIEPEAETGRRDVLLTIEGRERNLNNAFRVVEESFVVSPDRGRLGETVDIEITGSGTHWLQGRTWVNFGDGIDVLEFTVLSETFAEATISIEADASPGLRDPYTEDQGKIVTAYGGFTVDRVGLGAVFDPEQAEQGDTVEYTVFARGTNFLDGETTLAFFDGGGLNPDIRVDSVNVLDAENLWGYMTLSNAAELGLRDVLITTGEEGVRIPDAFEVVGGGWSLEEVAIDLSYTVTRGISNESGDISEAVRATCIFFIPLDPPCPSGGGMGSEPQPTPYDSNAVGPIIGSGGGGSDDCPTPTTLSAGDYVWLESEANTVTLYKEVDANTGMIIYTGRDLTIADYVTDNVYDLHLQGDPEGLEEELLEQVLPTVPADWELTSPQLWGNYTHDRTQDFVYTWTPAMTYPDAIFVTAINGTTYAGTSYQGRAISIPWDDGEHAYTASDLLQLDPNPVTFSAYSFIEGPPFGLRDSIYQENQSESYIYLQASMILE
ncbi:MAG: hypothetical protein H6741_14405 [Alphaproteobacteria bacterium]|nr:hypothetical protein [Alphaproteobacteria bacterium]MCB9793908.1 hypothetical protein [Alphaproteobacteria bacterium]